MKNGILIINGKKYKVQISDADVAAIAKPRTGYERVDNNQYYWRPTDNGQSYKSIETYCSTDDFRYQTGIYYNDEMISSNNVRADTLMRRLRQWQALNDKPVNWGNTSEKYFFEHRFNEIIVVFNAIGRHMGDIYFSSREKAEEALKIFADELIWYFTEYQQRLDEPKRKDDSNTQ